MVYGSLGEHVCPTYFNRKFISQDHLIKYTLLNMDVNKPNGYYVLLTDSPQGQPTHAQLLKILGLNAPSCATTTGLLPSAPGNCLPEADL